MSKMNLGLECLLDKTAPESHVLSYEYFDVLFEYNDACEELHVVFDRGETLFRAAANLKAVAEYIAQEGITPALEALVGENFENGLTEASVEAAKEGVWAKIKEWFIQLWNTIKQFFLKMFNNAEKLLTRLKNWVSFANRASADEFVGHEFTGVPIDVFDVRVSHIFHDMTIGKAKDMNESDVNKFSDFIKSKTIKFSTMSDAISYANELIRVLDSIHDDKSRMIKHIDENIADAKKIESEEDKNKQVAMHKSVKKIVNSYFKQLISSAAAFLAHNNFSNRNAEIQMKIGIAYQSGDKSSAGNLKIFGDFTEENVLSMFDNLPSDMTNGGKIDANTVAIQLLSNTKDDLGRLMMTIVFVRMAANKTVTADDIERVISKSGLTFSHSDVERAAEKLTKCRNK